MPSFKDITVVGIHGKSGIHNEIPSVEKTAKGLPGCKSLLITNEMVDSDITQKFEIGRAHV